MPFTRTVWILDIHLYLVELDHAVTVVSSDHLSLALCPPLLLGGEWADLYTSQRPKDGRERFIDWFICEQLDRLFYITIPHHRQLHHFVSIADDIRRSFDTERWAFDHFLLPRVYGDIFPVKIWRYGSWLYIESDIPTNQLRHHVLSINQPTRPTPKSVY